MGDGIEGGRSWGMGWADGMGLGVGDVAVPQTALPNGVPLEPSLATLATLFYYFLLKIAIGDLKLPPLLCCVNLNRWTLAFHLDPRIRLGRVLELLRESQSLDACASSGSAHTPWPRPRG